jgi:oligopeptide/dipeptide ABC transporter ATP-binding protein
MKAIPYVNKNVNRLYAIPGIVPDPLEFPSGCKFNPRCRFITERCKNEEPNLIEVEPGHKVRCWHYKE